MIDVIFEDNHLLVLNKPAGLLTQDSGTGKANLQDAVKKWLKQKYQKPGLVYLEPIHRLDGAASGLVVFAKTSKALSRLNESMRQRDLQKKYFALVSKGSRLEIEGHLKHYLIHDDHRARIVDKTKPQAKIAELHYKVVKEVPEGVLLEIELITGRYHQIRVQLTAIGSPILGDKKYGSTADWEGEGIALHHYQFEIEHPIKKEKCLFQSFPTWFADKKLKDDFQTER